MRHKATGNFPSKFHCSQTYLITIGNVIFFHSQTDCTKSVDYFFFFSPGEVFALQEHSCYTAVQKNKQTGKITSG